MSYTIINPATGEAMETVEHASVDQTDDAIERARVAQKVWAALAPAERAEALRAFARAVEGDIGGVAREVDWLTGSKGLVVVEMLTGLGEIADRDAFFIFAPIKIAATRGGYGRALALVADGGGKKP